jgi:hypothetical protein
LNSAARVAVTKTGESVALDTAPKETAARPSSFTQVVEEIKTELGERWIPRIYRERILPMRTRAHNLHAQVKKAGVEIQHTLLGVELKIGRHRLMCPDLATARYLAVFARAGCMDVAVPYDISRISSLADELESSWHRMLLLVENAAERRSAAFRSRLRNLLVGDVRREILEAGAGTAIPQFNQNTKQRRT